VSLIDSHCHLADETFETDLDAVIERARAAGVTDVVCILAAGDEPEAARQILFRRLSHRRFSRALRR